MATNDHTTSGHWSSRIPNPPDEATLRRFVESDHLSIGTLAKRFGVNRNRIMIWLSTYGIEYGPEVPKNPIMTKEALNQAFNVDFIGYLGAAQRFGVNEATISYWVKRYRIDTPNGWETKHKRLVRFDINEAKCLYESGVTLREIESKLGVSRPTIAKKLRQNGIEIRPDGFDGLRYTTKQGLIVRSVYELQVAEWMAKHGAGFEYEPKYPFNPMLRADFLANGWYIEIWGIQGNRQYQLRKSRKIKLCRSYGVPLIQFNYTHFAPRDQHILEARLNQILEPPSSSGMLF